MVYFYSSLKKQIPSEGKIEKSWSNVKFIMKLYAFGVR